MPTIPATRPPVPAFDRRFFDGSEQFTSIGSGAFGGKAHSLLWAKGLLEAGLDARHRRQFAVGIPTLTVIATDVFETFMKENGLWDLVATNPPDHRLASAFQAAQLPVELTGERVHGLRRLSRAGSSTLARQGGQGDRQGRRPAEEVVGEVELGRACERVYRASGRGGAAGD
jgi:hypothetical protein